LHRAQRGRIHYGANARRAFDATRTGLETTAAVTGAAAGPGRRFTPIAPPRDLQAALAPIDADKYGQKIFENLGVQDITPELVTRVCDLLLLRSYFLTHLGPRLAWLIKLSVTEWPTLSAQEKKLHTQMRQSFLTSYVFGAEAIIQHWLWKTLKTATKSFGPLLIVFADDYDATAACGTLAWERIFTAFPCAGTAITHLFFLPRPPSPVGRRGFS
jgi:hypothetical protein